MRNKRPERRRIPLFRILWDKRDVEYVKTAIESGENWAIGPYVSKFEREIASHTGSEYCSVFNSGTSALHAALLAHGIKNGDEVIVPSFTFIATANSVVFVGAKPVFADIEEKTLGLNPEDVVEKISKKTKAIMPIHYGGCPCKIGELRKIADDNSLILIEDASEAFGARIGRRKVGTYGDSGVFSFCQNKIITTGEGGAIVTDSCEIDRRLRLLRSHGKSESDNDSLTSGNPDYTSIGYNLRMSNITAALGIAQLMKVEKAIEKRRRNAEYFAKGLAQRVREIKTLLPPKNYYNVYQMYTIRSRRRNELMKYLADKGVSTKVYFEPVHLSHYYRIVRKTKCRLPVTEEVSREVLSLPMYPGLSRNEVEYIVDEIEGFYSSSPHDIEMKGS